MIYVQDGRTALHWAAGLSFHKAVKLLLDYRCNVLILDKDGNSPFHLAINSKNTKSFQAIMKALGQGFDPNIQDMVRSALLPFFFLHSSMP